MIRKVAKGIVELFYLVESITVMNEKLIPELDRPREFLECVSHVRLLSWLLMGALQHTALLSSANAGHQLPAPAACLPIPFDVSCHVADHIQGILAGFAEQSKASVLHMSSLYHAFLLCQVTRQLDNSNRLWNEYIREDV